MKLSKGVKIGIFLVVAILAGVFYWQKLKTSEVNYNAEKNVTPSVDLVELEKNYKDRLKELWPDYELALKSDGPEELADLREKLLLLKMPVEFKDTHVKLVLLLDKKENGAALSELLSELDSITKENPWLK